MSLLLGSSLVLALVLVPAMRRLALRTGFVDRPAARKVHRRPTPLLGGVAVVAAITLPLSIFGDAARWRPLLIAMLLVAAAGLWDDRRGLGVGGKLLAQLAAAAVLVASGVRVALPALPPLLALALTVIWLVGVSNAFNLLDNMDGVAGSVAAVAALGFLLLAPAASPPAMLAATVFGAVLGFLVYNLPPARIFMGDAGSLPLGLAMAVLSLELGLSTFSSAGWLLPLLVLAVPLFDTALVCVSRLRRWRNPLTTPGRDHLSHRLARRGAGPAGVVARIAALGAAGAVLALIVAAMPQRAPLTAGGVLALALIAGWRLERAAPGDAGRDEDLVVPPALSEP